MNADSQALSSALRRLNNDAARNATLRLRYWQRALDALNGTETELSTDDGVLYLNVCVQFSQCCCVRSLFAKHCDAGEREHADPGINESLAQVFSKILDLPAVADCAARSLQFARSAPQ
jgi:hypothetical protein